MPTKEECKLLTELAKLDNEKQALFFQSLQGIITENEKQALQVGIAYFRLLMFPELHNAMKTALSQELYTSFNSAF